MRLKLLLLSTFFFTSNAAEIAYTKQETLSSSKTLSVELSTGWNMVSIAGYQSSDISKVFGNTKYISVVYYYDTKKGYLAYTPGSSSNSYTTIEPTHGIWVNAISPFKVTFKTNISSSSTTTTINGGDVVESKAQSAAINSKNRREITFATGDTFISIPKGTFTMGDNRYSVLGASPEHSVTISKDFWISKNMVTNSQFNAFVTETNYQSDLQKSSSTGCYVYNTEDKAFVPTKGRYYANAFSNTASLGNHPVVCVSHNDALAYSKWLSAKLGVTISLATEAQWEYAAKGTTQKKFPWGDENPDASKANFADLKFSIEYAGSQQGKPTLSVDDGYGATSPVGSYPSGASEFGVLDMAGNASEWVMDYFDDYTADAKTDPTGPSTGDSRVNRGGNWVDDFSATAEKHTLITVSRAADDATSGDDHNGFRVVINQ